MILANEAAAPPQANGSATFAKEVDCFELMMLRGLLVQFGKVK